MANIKVARLRNRPYKVNYVDDGIKKTYVWSGSKGSIIDTKDIPEEVVNYLLMFTTCFKEGDLKIIENDESSKELASNIDNKEQYDNNTHSKEEIIRLLEGNFMKMKSELSKITVKQEKEFVVEVAKEINLDSSSKRQFIAEWVNIAEDLLFVKE
jgi:hypothetical protein